MEEEHNRAAKGQRVALMQAGQAFEEASYQYVMRGRGAKDLQVPENIRLIFQSHPVSGKNSQMVMRNGMGQGGLAPFYMTTDDAKSGSQ